MERRFHLRKFLSVLLAVCVIAVSIPALSMPVEAAGDGYSDIIKLYRINGINRDMYTYANARYYGSESNDAKDNYAFVTTYNAKRGTRMMSVINGDEFEKILNGAMSYEIQDVASYNEFLLSLGMPDDLLLTSDKPQIVKNIEKAIKEKSSTLKVKGGGVIMPDALKFAASKLGKNFKISVDNIDKGGLIRMTVTPSKCTKGVVLMASLDSTDISFIQEKFAKVYSNKFATIIFNQDGSFGTTVKIAAKVNLKGMNTKTLKFYQYDPLTNKTYILKDKEYSIDKNGYLHFSIKSGGPILITDKALTKK